MTFCIRAEKAEDTIKLPTVDAKLDDMCQSLLNKVSEAIDEKLASFEDKNEEWCRRQEELVHKLLPRTDKQILAMSDLNEVDTQTEFESREMATQTEDDTDTLFSANTFSSNVLTSGRKGRRKSGSGLDSGDGGGSSDEIQRRKNKRTSKKSKDLCIDTEDSPDEAMKNLRSAGQEPDNLDDLEQSPGQRQRSSNSTVTVATIESTDSPGKLESDATQRRSPASGSPSMKKKKSIKDKPKAADADLDLIADMQGARDIDTKMQAVAMKWGLSKHPRMCRIITRTDGPLSIWVKGPLFKSVANILVFANIFFIVLQAEHSVSNASQGKKASEMFAAADVFFTVAFGVDLALRLVGERASILFSKDRLWNIMDIVLVVADIFNQVFTLIMSAIGQNAPDGMFGAIRGAARACRAGRVARTLRIFRSFSFFSLPREVVSAFGAVPFMILIYFFIALFFGLIFMQAAAESQLNENASTEGKQRMRHYFGTVGNSVISLVLVLLRAMDWIEIYEAIQETSNMYSLVFLCFAFFAIVAFMNAITAMCVQSCLARVVKNEMSGKTEAATKLSRFLIKSDQEAGTCTWGRLSSNLDNALVRGNLENLGLDLSDAKSICHLMSKGEHRPVDLSEFSRACVKFTRSVRGSDFLPVLLANKRLISEFREFTDEWRQFASQQGASTKKLIRKHNTTN